MNQNNRNNSTQGNTRAGCWHTRHIWLALTSLLVTFGVFGSTMGQQVEKDISNKTPITTASVISDGVRIAAPSAVVQLRLEVYDEAGQKLFDTKQKGGDVLDWHLEGRAGERLLDGTYLCVVSIRNPSGREEQKLGLVTVAAQSITVRPAGVADLTPSQAQVVGAIEGEDNGLAVVPAESAPPVTVLAHNGEEAQLTRTSGALSFRAGDFFSANDKEQMRLTEDGRLGIGTANPQATLDVAGTIHARDGITFNDGRTLNVTDKGALTLTDSKGEGTVTLSSDANITPNVAGTGSVDKLAKWTDNGGTLGDSVITESSGNVGIGTTNPFASFEVQQPAGATAPNMFLSQAGTASRSAFQFLKVGSNTWSFFGHNLYFNGTTNVLADPTKSGWAFYANGDATDAFYVYSKPPAGGDNYPFVLKRDGRLKLSSGNFAAPGNNQLEVQVQNPAYAGTVIKGAPAQSANLLEAQNSGGTVLSKIDKNGNLSVGTSTSPTGGVATFNGNVGIGTTSPGAMLDVAGNINVNGTVRTAGTVESTSGGFKFPDGSVQASAATNKTYVNSSSTEIELVRSGTEVLQLDLPAGTYLITASVELENRANVLFQDNSRFVRCYWINPHGANVDIYVRLAGSGSPTDQAPMTVQSVSTRPMDSRLALTCYTSYSGDRSYVVVKGRTLTAIRLGDVVTQ